MPEITGRQLAGSGISITTEPAISNPQTITPTTIRTMRRHPTIALVRTLGPAAIVNSSWSVEAEEGVDPAIVEFIKKQFIPIRQPLLETALLGGFDFGWQGFEKIFAVNSDNLVELVKLKPLLHDITTILVDDRGRFQGFSQGSGFAGGGTIVPLANSFLASYRVEGTQWYGSSLIENMVTPFNSWVAANAGADLYDKKIAGTHLVIKYPLGTTPVAGVEKDNAIIAQEIRDGFRASGSFLVPNQIKDEDGEALNREWHIELMGDGGAGQSGFTDRLKHLETLMVRGAGFPERAILEGTHGTKADAGQHADLALTALDLMHQHTTRLVNFHIVNPILAINFGLDSMNSVWIKPAPIANDRRGFIEAIYLAILNSNNNFDLLDRIDMARLTVQTEVPLNMEPPETRRSNEVDKQTALIQQLTAEANNVDAG